MDRHWVHALPLVKHDDAIVDYDKAIELNPHFELAKFQRARVHLNP